MAEDVKEAKEAPDATEPASGDYEEPDYMDSIIVKAAIVAVVFGIILASYLIWVTAREPYSALYIYPESYSNYVKPGEDVTFRYGIVSHEIGDTEYLVEFYLGQELVKSKKVVLGSGEVREENESIILPESISYPVQVRIRAYANNVTYEAYFWLKKS